MKLLNSTFVSFALVALVVSCKPSADEQREIILTSEKELLEGATMVADSLKAAALCSKYIEFSSDYPQDSMSAEFLFRAGDLAQGIGDFSRSIGCYETLLTVHPESKKAPAAFFMQAFVLDQRAGDKKAAAAKYQSFLEKYPGHPLAASAKASLDQINSGMSDEDLVRMFQQRADSIEKASGVTQ